MSLVWITQQENGYRKLLQQEQRKLLHISLTSGKEPLNLLQIRHLGWYGKSGTRQSWSCWKLYIINESNFRTREPWSTNWIYSNYVGIMECHLTGNSRMMGVSQAEEITTFTRFFNSDNNSPVDGDLRWVGQENGVNGNIIESIRLTAIKRPFRRLIRRTSIVHLSFLTLDLEMSLF